jgi:hypothetical protein
VMDDVARCKRIKALVASGERYHQTRDQNDKKGNDKFITAGIELKQLKDGRTGAQWESSFGNIAAGADLAQTS